MVGIAAITISGASPAATTAVSSEAQKVEGGQGTSVQADTSKLRKSDQAQSAQGSEDSGEPAHIKQLREMIKKLQKQLAEEQKQLAALMAQKMDETAKLAAVGAKQASIATLNGQILQATAQLLEALQTTGGSSAGGMVSTQA